jgi:hypothetical protein
VHGIAHAGWAPGTVHSLISDALFDEDEKAHADPAAADARTPSYRYAHDLHHSCVAYDAAALSAGVHFDFPPCRCCRRCACWPCGWPSPPGTPAQLPFLLARPAALNSFPLQDPA